MSKENMNDVLYEEARKRVKKKKSFYGHLGLFVAVGVFFLLLDFTTNDGNGDVLIPMIPWSLGLTLHYISVFGLPFTKGVLTEDWEDRETAAEMRKLGERFETKQEKLDLNNDELPLKLREIERRRNYNDSDLV